ncbi:IncP-type conjugal transfer protein TrbI [Rhizobium calliandrae]|uniref:IncP-type conjugal transfer protein TrbI n=1 Tax=Rhizobium calliandrae TaxID=1312182 RepID=A0ABT7KC14_9HYPH|nr:IncP-type conjugal transfer protein TrbI [Rhizobium calliandrae]MDL2406150.1 IncP-type conjugal transfer protein TrbI [Rhizobium calliandrae]
MVQSLQLGPANSNADQKGMRRLNRLPIIISILVVALFLGVVVIGLSWRGLSLGRGEDPNSGLKATASNFGDQLKRGISDGIIGEPAEREIFQPAPVEKNGVEKTSPQPKRDVAPVEDRRMVVDSDEAWRARLKREEDEQYLREAQRQRLARLQARAVALDSPLTIDLSGLVKDQASSRSGDQKPSTSMGNDASDLYAAALKSGLVGQDTDPNGQSSKERFLNQDFNEPGYLPNRLVSPISPYELKRGSVVPATLITGLDSDLPGRIIAQVSQDIYDSATGYHLLVPQGAKLFGRYDSRVSFGQGRILVVWTDIVFPDGSTLQLGAMAGTDAEGYGGFSDEVDRHLLRTFGSAALVAIIGTGIDMSIPESSTLATQNTASDAARRNFADTFGRVAEQTISKSLNVQPTIRIRPGFVFNVIVDQDIVFPKPYVKAE